MQHLLETQSGRDLQWFFDGWVYHDRGLPQLRVESAYPRPTTNHGYVVTVTVENPGDVGAEVPLTLKMVEGEVTRRLEVHAKAKISVRIDCLSTPIEVVLNDGSVPEKDARKSAFKIEIPATVR
jgi:aminopeptidase N